MISAKVRKKALKLLRERHLNLDESDPAYLSLRDIAKQVGGVSHQLLSVWSRQDMNDTAIIQRAQHRVWNALLTDHQERLLAGMLFYRSIRDLNTTTGLVITFCRRHFGVEVNPSWVTRWKHKMHFSSQRIVAASTVEFLPDKLEDSIKLVRTIRAKLASGKLSPSQLYAVDKMYIGDQPTHAVQIAPKGLYAIRDATVAFCSIRSGHPRRLLPPDRHGVDAQWTTLVADGTLGVLYVETHKKVTKTERRDMHIRVLEKGDTGRGTGGLRTLKFFKWMIDNGQFKSGDVSMSHGIQVL